MRIEPGFEPGTRIQERTTRILPPEKCRHGVVTDHYIGMNSDELEVRHRGLPGYGFSVTVLWDENIGYYWCNINRIKQEEIDD